LPSAMRRRRSVFGIRADGKTVRPTPSTERF
jgi:hypothetical protein